MKILAFDTSGDCCSAALLIGDRLEQCREQAPRRHADLILGMLDALLRGASLTPKQLDAIAYGRGPGSFTGVRIAAAVAQGLAFGAERPVISVSTLAAVARAAFRESGQRQIACALDARMGEVYWGCYRIGEHKDATPIDEETVIAPDLTPALPGAGWCGAGSGWAAYPALMSRHQSALLAASSHPHETAQRLVLPGIGPLAEDIAWEALRMVDQAQHADQAVPTYLRNQVTHVSHKRAANA
ncbi:MAG: tRNA (adenosine(37)-N6)-threonylcarbamoyltransferase complex dimerization subunit type 1 TsaB [Lamprobacter sp.]|uniref:tRNA (adenosine(37)-N6)-threonylcarbamoyltransferase complex dimerization subunit type 1 TsaB n=1 Tax=Lamprobacter sp. TaxID=3100796 RepID=UPI002B25E766|nr:tRNA (adenosine(37)-N6)-threonylcarbamoyltransferase complex dimerization subunit type 1 TsaB [Lamprobacter sp.]MEA3638973.1 tRNA (adenosine(37)-N6)-threonylcarbamoyltransferase complex dimerization subunit type 1 TsaB [Lamprobacter sp.]